jgi:hypothetical protein
LLRLLLPDLPTPQLLQDVAPESPWYLPPAHCLQCADDTAVILSALPKVPGLHAMQVAWPRPGWNMPGVQLLQSSAPAP